MNFKKLVHETWKDERVRKLKVKKGEVQTILSVMLEKMIDGLISERTVKLRGFFTVELRKVKGRTTKIGDNEVKYDDYDKVAINPSEKIKKRLKNK